jgi:signal transduction histidine kinase
LDTRGTTDEYPLLLANLPPSQTHVRFALSIVAVLLIAFAATLPFRDILLPNVVHSIPMLQTAITINDLITAVLLYAQFSIVRQRGLLILASGYLYSALIVIPYALTFPGVYGPTGLLGGGLQTTPWIYWCWHVGLPLAVIGYASLKDMDGRTTADHRPASVVVSCSAGIVIAFVCGLALLAIAGERLLPTIMSDGVKVNVSLGVSLIYGGSMLLPVVIALALLWRRRHSVLDLWLKVMCVAWLVEIVLGTVLATARFTVGWYGSRIYALIAAIILLIVLLSETTTLYANLARSVLRQRGAREARQVAMDAMAASIAHEINQPLAAISLNTETALLCLAGPTLEVDEARAALHSVADDSHRANAVIKGIRSMYRKGSHGRAWLDVNGLVREALATAEIELRTHHVSVSTELHKELPQVLAHRGQLQQVFQNLILNAIEAMQAIPERSRVLRIRSSFNQHPKQIVVSIEDCGTGIDEKDKDRIFEPFFTTKSTGTGIGLTICQSIIETHGGELQAFANRPSGTIFEVILRIDAAG